MTDTKMLRSELCKAEHLEADWYLRWCNELREAPKFHRKQWEFVYVMQALWERGCIAKDKKGLAFAVGSEPMPSLFANYGCRILATDIAVSSGKEKGWTNADQLCIGLESLNKRGLCDEETLYRQVSYRSVDMNAIPRDLQEFDFNWSCCALEHLGSIKKGSDFLMNQMDTLKPGGWAVHTTEYNLSSEEETITEGDTVVFRRKDIDDIAGRLRVAGHSVAAIDLSMGFLPEDYEVDYLPHKQEIHLRLQLDRFVVTSIGLVIQKNKRKRSRFLRLFN